MKRNIMVNIALSALAALSTKFISEWKQGIIKIELIENGIRITRKSKTGPNGSWPIMIGDIKKLGTFFLQ